MIKEFSSGAQKLTGPNTDTIECMNLLFRLFALSRINANIGIWLEVGYFTGDQA